VVDGQAVTQSDEDDEIDPGVEAYKFFEMNNSPLISRID